MRRAFDCKAHSRTYLLDYSFITLDRKIQSKSFQLNIFFHSLFFQIKFSHRCTACSNGGGGGTDVDSDIPPPLPDNEETAEDP